MFVILLLYCFLSLFSSFTSFHISHDITKDQSKISNPVKLYLPIVSSTLANQNEKNRKYDIDYDRKRKSKTKNHSFQDQFKKKKGSKTQKTFDSSIQYNKGKKKSYERDNVKGGVKMSHDKSKSAEDTKAGNYNSKYQHDKGSKSKGYHNLFMKDEYKKEHTFYGKYYIIF